MTLRVDLPEWECGARALESLADGLGEPPRLTLPDDRYGRAAGEVPAASDGAARDAHRAAADELRGMAARIRQAARAAAETDETGARSIAAVE